MKTLALAAVAALALPNSGHAQQAVAGPRWQGWIGCWSASPSRVREDGPEAQRIVCVTPTSEPDAVDVSAIADGKVVTQNRIDASGATHDVTAPGCTGTESARWSGDGRRVFLKSHVTCDGLATEMNAILAITRTGEWIDVRRVAAGGGSDVRVARYHDVGVPTVVPSDVAAAFDRRNDILFHDARTIAGSAFSPRAIIEASRTVDAGVVESWVSEVGQTYPVDARSLNELAVAGVPARVTDAMLAVSRPTEVATHHVYMYPYSPYGWNSVGTSSRGNYGPYANYGPYGINSADAWDQGNRSRLTINIYEYDPWGWSAFPFGYRFGAPPFGYGLRYGNGSRFGDGMGLGYGFGYESRRYGTSGSRQGYYYPPVIVLHNDPTGSARPRGHDGDDRTADVRQAGNTGRTAQPRPIEPPREAVRPPAPAAAPQPRQPESRPSEAPQNQGSQSSGRSAKPRG
jgi:hypothetical protein